MVQKTSGRVTAQDLAEKELANRNVTAGVVKFPPKTQVDEAHFEGKSFLVKANMFPVTMKKKIVVYKVNVDKAELQFIPSPSRPDHVGRLNLLKMSRNQTLTAARIELNRNLFNLLVEHGQMPNLRRDRMYYDGMRGLFSLDKFQDAEWVVSVDNTVDRARFYQAHPFAGRINYQFAGTTATIELGHIPNFDEAVSNPAGFYRPLFQFIETATTEAAIEDDEFVAINNGSLYSRDPEKHGIAPPYQKLPRGVYNSSGMRKSARIIEGGRSASGSAQAVLVVKPVTKPFHIIQKISDKVLANFPSFEMNPNGSRAAVEKMLTGIYVKAVHLESPKEFKVVGIGQNNARNQFFVNASTNEPITVEAYYNEQYNVELAHPFLPVLIALNADKKEIYLPMEMYEVADNQPLSGDYAKSLTSETLLVNCVIPPVFEHKTLRCVQALNLNESRRLQPAGLNIDVTEFKEVEANALKAPRVIYANNESSMFDRLKSSWSPKKFLYGSEIKTWAIVVVERAEPQTFKNDDLVQFIGKYMKSCRNQGMMMDQPSDYQLLNLPANGGSEFGKLTEYFDLAQRMGTQFIVLISDKSDKNIHPHLKLCEQQYGIVTQNITLDTVQKFMQTGGNMETVMNVIQKSNEKCGGDNFYLQDVDTRDLLGENDLFIGIAKNQEDVKRKDSERDSAFERHSVFGYCANDNPTLLHFTGDYCYAEPRRGEINLITYEIMNKVLQRYKNSKGVWPKRVFLFLNGFAEGQFADLLTYAVQLARKAIKDLHCSASLNVIAPTKRHNVRLIEKQFNTTLKKPRELNLKPGTAVHHGIVDPKYDNFYLISHLASLGTANPAHYAVIVNDGHLQKGEMMAIVYTLCFAVKIINKTISLPAPVHIALEMAKRGAMNLKTHTTVTNLNGNSPPGRDYNQVLTENLSYGNNPLRNVRFNA